MSTVHRKQKSSHGFSLLELMVTLAVAAILLLIAVPSFRDAIHRNQVSSASNALLAGLSYARTEAINRSQLVSMCPSLDGASCTGGQAFDPGWIIYTYPAGAASANKAYSAPSIIVQASGARAGASIQAKGTAVITFGQQGQLDPSGTTLEFVTCYRDSGTGTGTSSTSVPGAQLDMGGSGGVRTTVWPVGKACTP